MERLNYRKGSATGIFVLFPNTTIRRLAKYVKKRERAAFIREAVNDRLNIREAIRWKTLRRKR